MERAKISRTRVSAAASSIARPNPSANLCVVSLYQLPGHCAGAQCRSTAASPYHPRHNRRSRLSGRSGCAENTSRTVRLRQWEATSCGTRFFRGTPEKTGRYLRQPAARECSTRLKGVRRAGPGRGACRDFGSRLFRPQRIARSHYCRTNRRTGKRNRSIENLISVPRTTGSQLADALRTHIEHYPIEIFEDRKIERAELQGKEKKVFSGGGGTFTAPAVIIATGASWRKLNVEGEAEYLDAV